MDWDKWIRYFGWFLLVCDSVWTIAWWVTGIIEATTTSPLPATIISGIPLSVYDTVAEYLAAHIGMALHFLMSGSMFLLAAAGGDELITIWYTLPLGAVVAKDSYAVLERYLHLSRTAHPTFFVYEAALAISALSISILAMIWFQVLYWRWRYTLHRFDEEYAERKKHELENARHERAAADSKHEPPQPAAASLERPLLQHPFTVGQRIKQRF